MNYNFVLRMWMIVFGAFTGFIIYVLFLRPLFYQACILNSSSALRIQYQSWQNSVLVHMQPTGYWIWFDGVDILIYGEPTGYKCKDKDFESVYVIDTTTGQPVGYRCAKSLVQVQQFYKDKKRPLQYIYKRTVEKNFGVMDVINLMSDRKIISIQTAKLTSKFV